MNRVKNYTTVHLWLNQIDVLEVAILIMTYIIKNVKKTEDLNLRVFNMITVINESKTLAKHILWECKCKFDGRKCNLNQKQNNDKCRCESKKHYM